MLKVVAVNNADPQNPLQAVAIHVLQPIPLCLRQRPYLTTIDKVRNDKRAKNLHLGLHQKVAIPTYMGELHKNTQPMRTTNIKLFLQASQGVDNASQILERLHQLHRTTANWGVSR
jgi:hypothetical protein